MYQPISVIQLQKLNEQIKSKYNLTIPTYTVKLPDNNIEVHKHTPESIVDKNTTQQEQDDWKLYQEQLTLFQDEVNEKSMAYMFYEGVDCEVTDEWKNKQTWLGLELPDNQFDLKVRYVTTEILKTPADIRNATTEIMKLSMKGVDQSAIQAAEKSFPDLLSAE